MGIIGTAIGALFLLALCLMFALLGHTNVIDGAQALTESITKLVRMVRDRERIYSTSEVLSSVMEILVAFCFLVFFGLLWIAGLLAVPYILYQLSKQLPPYGLIASIALAIFIVIGAIENRKK